MPQFRFTATNAAGQQKRGTIEALTREEAVARLNRKGLTADEVLNLESSAPASKDGLQNNFEDLVSESPQPTPPTSSNNANRTVFLARLPSLPVMLSLFSLLIALFALTNSLLRDPLGSGLEKYDFSTPESSAKAIYEIRADGSFRADLDLTRLKDGTRSADAVRTFEISRTADFGDKKVVFVSFMQQGKKQNRLMWFVKDLESKMWLPTYVSPFKVKESNEQLAKDMKAWDDDSSPLE